MSDTSSLSPTARRLVGRLLEGRTAIVSGAARPRGIGKAVAALFVEHGARVALLDQDGDGAATAARDIDPSGNSTIGLPCDVARAEDCQSAVERVMAWAPSGGHIDVLVNNAGVTQRRTVPEIAAEDFDLVLDVVLRGTLLLSQAVIPHMQRQRAGAIVSVSSMSAQQGGGIFGGAHYGAAKAGVLALTRSMARELGGSGIRANAITPGLVLTDFSRSGTPDEAKHAMAAGWPLQRAADASEIAGACLFLASDLASYVTGTTLDVNGGAYLR